MIAKFCSEQVGSICNWNLSFLLKCVFVIHDKKFGHFFILLRVIVTMAWQDLIIMLIFHIVCRCVFPLLYNCHSFHVKFSSQVS